MPGGEPRNASQRNTRRAAPIAFRIAPIWRAGDQVRWKGRAGVFRRDVGDGEHAEVVIGERVYRVRVSELGVVDWLYGQFGHGNERVRQNHAHWLTAQGRTPAMG